MDNKASHHNPMSRYQALVLALLAITLILPLWHHHGMNSVFIVDADSSLEVVPTDDRWQGGKSVATITHQENTVKLDCTLSDAYQWPYCEAVYKLATNDKPLDLSGYEFLRVRIHSQGPGPQNVKLYLRQYDPAFTTIENDTSLKVNQIEFDPNKESFPVDIPLSNFTVAPWWINSMQLSSLEETTEFNAIVHFDIATGGFRQPGKHEILIHGLEFHGKWISYGQLVTLLLLLWGSASLLALGHNYFIQKRGYLNLNKSLGVPIDEDDDEDLVGARAQKDYLTGTYNRLGLRQFMIDLVSTYRRKEQPFVVCFLEISGFQELKNNEGPAVCDALLQTLAQLVSDETRGSDILGRWSTDRFILLCGNSTLLSTKALTDKLRLKMSMTNWPSALKVTCNFGLAEIAGNEDIGQVIERAEQNLNIQD